ncbi:MAG: glutamate racemase [Pseudarcicella sp.]|nr:glutamate racemase [Pseudarcicella sp.]MBP6410614.1 glutamate racemase [Pseudarcicella sp.]
MQSNTSPIGIFDSGIGGLTVAKAVTRLLPNEDIIYFGDTAHLPYGDKSASAIQAYSVKICNLLLEKSCKVILIACNSASAAAYELVKEYIGSKALVVNVIDPVVDYIANNFENQKIGLIGTKQTVNSEIYFNKIVNLEKNIQLQSLATPLLAPMIEEGFFNNTISEQIIHEYLSNNQLSNIEALILACTHYPLIKTQIEKYYGGNVNVLDTSEIVANFLKEQLTLKNLHNNVKVSKKHFYVSDYTKSFETSTKIFFNEQIELSHYPLWE